MGEPPNRREARSRRSQLSSSSFNSLVVGNVLQPLVVRPVCGCVPEVLVTVHHRLQRGRRHRERQQRNLVGTTSTTHRDRL